MNPTCCQICGREILPTEPTAPDHPEDLDEVCARCWHQCQEIGLELGEVACRVLSLIKGRAVPGNGGAP